MSNVRPWFRFSSVANKPISQRSSDAPPPQPLPTPRRPVIVRPPVKQPSPPRQQTPPPPPPPPQEQSPYHSPPSRHMSPPNTPKAASPPPRPPRSSYTPPPSPKEVQEALPSKKPNSPPSQTHSTRSIKFDLESSRKAPSPQRVLSPYSLPPSQLHSERETTHKNILTVEKTSHLHNHNHNHQGNNNKKNHHHPSSSEFDNIMNTRVITIAGENKGAVMVLNGVEEKGQRLQSRSSDEGEDKKKKTKNPNNIGNNSNLPMKAFMNSNVQMINNSIVCNSMATHHDPGIHLKIYRNPGSGNGLHIKDYGNNDGYTN